MQRKREGEKERGERREERRAIQGEGEEEEEVCLMLVWCVRMREENPHPPQGCQGYGFLKLATLC